MIFNYLFQQPSVQSLEQVNNHNLLFNGMISLLQKSQHSINFNEFNKEYETEDLKTAPNTLKINKRIDQQDSVSNSEEEVFTKMNIIDDEDSISSFLDYQDNEPKTSNITPQKKIKLDDIESFQKSNQVQEPIFINNLWCDKLKKSMNEDSQNGQYLVSNEDTLETTNQKSPQSISQKSCKVSKIQFQKIGYGKKMLIPSLNFSNNSNNSNKQDIELEHLTDLLDLSKKLHGNYLNLIDKLFGKNLMQPNSNSNTHSQNLQSVHQSNELQSSKVYSKELSTMSFKLNSMETKISSQCFKQDDIALFFRYKDIITTQQEHLNQLEKKLVHLKNVGDDKESLYRYSCYYPQCNNRKFKNFNALGGHLAQHNKKNTLNEKVQFQSLPSMTRESTFSVGKKEDSQQMLISYYLELP